MHTSEWSSQALTCKKVTQSSKFIQILTQKKINPPDTRGCSTTGCHIRRTQTGPRAFCSPGTPGRHFRGTRDRFRHRHHGPWWPRSVRRGDCAGDGRRRRNCSRGRRGDRGGHRPRQSPAGLRCPPLRRPRIENGGEWNGNILNIYNNIKNRQLIQTISKPNSLILSSSKVKIKCYSCRFHLLC